MTLPDGTWAALQTVVAEAAANCHAPSLSWGLMVDGRLAHCGGVGALGDGSVPDEHTVFRIASMTKSFTAAAVLALRDEGVWTLDDPVARHAPELADVRGPDDSPAITLRHLLSMAAGIATDDAWADRHLDMTIEEIDAVYSAGPLFAHRTNDEFQYSNLGFGMLGRCVRRATGRTVQDHITERFHRPLGMDHTTWVEPGDGRWARPFRWEDDTVVDDLPHPLGDGEISPMGGIWTTVADLCAWMSWLDRANAPTGDHVDGAPMLLSSASRRELQRMQTYIGMRALADVTAPTGYGFGLVVRDDSRLGKVVDHSGGLPGYGSNMRWVAGRGVGAVALANVTYAPMSDLTMRMIYAANDLGVVPAARVTVAPELQRAAGDLVALLDHWDDDLAARLFADNVALDESLERREAAARRLRDTHGPLRLVGVRPSSSSSAEIEVCGSGDAFRVEFDLAPLHPPQIQYYGILTT